MPKLIFPFFLIIYSGCANIADQDRVSGKKVNSIATGTHPNIRETRLGESNYFLQLPGTFKLFEAQGKEGQLGYGIIPEDNSSTMLGFIEIKHGDPIGEKPVDNSSPQEIISAYFLDKKVLWRIYKTETGYFVASTDEKGDLNANASSKRRNEIDSLIMSIATLRQK